MPHSHSVLAQITQRIPWAVFEASVSAYNADHRVRRLRTRDQFLALLYGQLSGAASLREIENGLLSHQNRLYHVGGRSIRRSTLSDANAKRPFEVYRDVFAALVTRARPGLRRKLRGAIRLIDATSIALSSHSASWISRQQGHYRAKVHVVYDPVNTLPLHADITPQNVNDITPARALEIEPGATYVFDLGYYSYEWWHKMNRMGCRFVTRLKTTTHLRAPERQACPEGGSVVFVQTGTLPPSIKRGRNPYSDRVREVHVRCDDGRVLRLITNDLESPVNDIAALYKQRWEIELFFKWIKQNLRLHHFIGRGPRAVKTQIYIALIAFLLLRECHGLQTRIKKLQAFTRLLRLNLMHRKPITNLISDPDKPPPEKTSQLKLALS